MLVTHAIFVREREPPQLSPRGSGTCLISHRHRQLGAGGRHDSEGNQGWLADHFDNEGSGGTGSQGDFAAELYFAIIALLYSASRK
ncbi:hypothetical protein [Singulisphaera acidiphila]|uniref:hypothetical protein n=1 Tax=Singulisphaera acidiphila TaxID=466153 RepID=UPI000315FB30|nr:hypothetical protein [Singulisphaera acidiphila]